LHRLWYVGGRYAYASALLDGFTDYIFVTIDMADPTRPQLLGRWWLPGMNQAAGETPRAPPGRRRALHHVLVHGDTAYACWRDGGEIDYAKKPGHFGPHNLHENGPGSFVSDRLVFATWQNAGIRVFDLSDPYRPVEAGALVPAAPKRMTDKRPGRPQVIQSADVFVDAQGLVYATDDNAGLEIIEYDG
jgi:hypothetical protein